MLCCDLAGNLLPAHYCGYWKQTEAWQSFNVSLYMVGVTHLDAHHLVAAADAEHCCPFTVCFDDSLRTSIAAELIEVVQGGFGARQNDDVGLVKVIHIIGIEKMYARVLLQRVEVCIVERCWSMTTATFTFPCCVSNDF